MVLFLQGTQRLLNHPVFPYLTLILLQLKVVWRIWDYKDLTSGDTSSYFLDAHSWFEHRTVHILWSPTYTAFYGSLLHITSDVYVVAILHRLIIVFAASILMLALMRKLLPHGLAWLISAWWVILPINFNTLYEVHLFSILPLFAASLLVLAKQAIWTRGGAIAILVASAVLVRNEQLVAVFLFTAICIFWEIRQFIITKQKPALRKYVLGYGVPLLLAGLVILFFVIHSSVPVPSQELSADAKVKHVLNICQVYAAGYQQRHPDWALSPWTDCAGLMEKTFGQPYPSLSEALRANPAAMVQHFAWNIGLTLNGIQVALFNATSGMVNPDYAPVTLNAKWVIIPTIAAGAVLIAGLFLLYRDRQYWWQTWLKERAMGWFVLISIAAVAVFVVIPTQRPRPSYLFSLTILLMASIGMSLFIIFHRFSSKNLKHVVPFLAVVLLIAVPSYYTETGRPMLDLYNRFKPFQDVIANKETTFLTREYSFDLCSYLQKSEICNPLSYADQNFFAGVPETLPLQAFLRKRKVNLFYVDESLLAKLQSNPLTAKFLSKPGSVSWKLIAMQDESGSKWMLFQKLKRVKKI